MALESADLQLILEIGLLSEESNAPCFPLAERQARAEALAVRGLLSVHSGSFAGDTERRSFALTPRGRDWFNLQMGKCAKETQRERVQSISSMPSFG